MSSFIRRWLGNRGDSARRPPEAAEHLLNSLFVMASMVEARDPYTGGHLWRVSQYSHLLAEDAGLTDFDQARVALGGFLHDLGKVGVPDALLNKMGSFTDDEYEVVKTHPDAGNRLLHNHPLATLVQAAVHAHHERPDGQGYPLKLLRDEIPIDARIVSICDAFDAMTSTRPYRRGMPLDKALQIIRDNLGTQFDTELGDRFIALGETGLLDYIIGHSEQGIPLQECPNCGPTIVVRRGQEEGEHVYCRACGGEARLVRKNDLFEIEPTGQRGSPDKLGPDVDSDLVSRLVSEASVLFE